MKILSTLEILFLTSLALSCSDAKLNGEVTAGSKNNAADSLTDSKAPAVEPIKQPDAVSPIGASPSTQSSGSTTIDLPSVPAISPVVISGASLTCSLTTDTSAHCYAKASKGEPLDFAVADAFLIKGSPAAWTPTTFIKLGIGEWSVDVTGVTGSFGIAVRDAAAATLADWIIRAPDAPVNLVNDGGFETLIHATKSNEPYQYIAPTPTSIWQARFVKDFTGCKVVMMEIQLAHDDVRPTEGRRLVELNSACRDTALDTPSPIAMYQTVKNLVKDNLYEIRLDYRRRADLTAAVGFQITVGNQLLPAVSVTQTGWQEYRTIVKAESIEALLSIEETTRHASGIGTLIDNVRIYDLGSGKE